jgi:hypothetical protein
MSTSTYPVRVEAHLDDRLSRWLWLVKWLLAIPHYLVLIALWVAFAVLSVVAFVAILVTGRYPRGIFDFNVGVLRWTWRVTYYAYGALGTDHYPPFALREVPEYPAHLTVDYPARLSRGLVLVKWWLLALPQYLVVAVFVGGGLWLGSAAANGDRGPVQGVGLIGLLVLVAAVVLLFTGRYPASLFDLVLGLNRWVLRVAAYAALMTDAYPPFRLDMGGADPGGAVLDVTPPPAGAAAPGAAVGSAPPQQASSWHGSTALAVVGGLLMVLGLGGAGAGGAVLAVDATQRDAAGYLMTPSRTLSSPGYAVVSQQLQLDASTDRVPRALVGKVRVDARSTDGRPLFLGIARSADVQRYLGGVSRSDVTDIVNGRPVYREQAGGAPATAPGRLGIWTVRDQGFGARSVRWDPRQGSWTVVVMTVTGSRGVSASAAAGATLPWLTPLGWAMTLLGLVLLSVGIVLLVLGLRSPPPPTTR